MRLENNSFTGSTSYSITSNVHDETLAEKERNSYQSIVLARQPELDLESGISDEFMILYADKFIRGEREIVVTEDDLDHMVGVFNRWLEEGQEVAIDYDHSFQDNGSSLAAGWLKSLVRRGQELYARVQWSPKALKHIRDGEYRYFSPEFSADWKGGPKGESEGYTLLGGALTNRPFLRGRTAVALAQEVAEDIADYADDLDVEDGATMRADLRQAGCDTRDMPDEPANSPEEKVDTPAPEEPEKVTLTVEQFRALEEQAAKAAKLEKAREEAAKGPSVTMTADEHERLRRKAGEAETFEQRLIDAEAKVERARFTEIYTRAKREGRIDAKVETEDRWFEVFKSMGEEKMQVLLPPAETIPVTERGRPGEPYEDDIAPGSVDPEAQVFHRKVERAMQQDPNLTYEDAVQKLEQAGELY